MMTKWKKLKSFLTHSYKGEYHANRKVLYKGRLVFWLTEMSKHSKLTSFHMETNIPQSSCSGQGRVLDRQMEEKSRCHMVLGTSSSREVGRQLEWDTHLCDFHSTISGWVMHPFQWPQKAQAVSSRGCGLCLHHSTAPWVEQINSRSQADHFLKLNQAVSSENWAKWCN